jgi:hypothetical protein
VKLNNLSIGNKTTHEIVLELRAVLGRVDTNFHDTNFREKCVKFRMHPSFRLSINKQFVGTE